MTCLPAARSRAVRHRGEHGCGACGALSARGRRLRPRRRLRTGHSQGGASCDSPQKVMRYCDAREAFYRRLAEKNPKLAVFLKGWLNRLNGLRNESGCRASSSCAGVDSGNAAYIAKDSGHRRKRRFDSSLGRATWHMSRSFMASRTSLPKPTCYASGAKRWPTIGPVAAGRLGCDDLDWCTGRTCSTRSRTRDSRRTKACWRTRAAAVDGGGTRAPVPRCEEAAFLEGCVAADRSPMTRSRRTPRPCRRSRRARSSAFRCRGSSRGASWTRSCATSITISST